MNSQDSLLQTNNEELNLGDLEKNIKKNEKTISDLDKIITIWIQTLERLFPKKIPLKAEIFKSICKKLRIPNVE